MDTQKQKTILLVEDEALTAVLNARIIKDFGYEVITANTGETAVEVAISNENINLILMDIDLGVGIEGTEAAIQILAKRHIPIIFLTSHCEKEYVNKVKEITRYGYLIKGSSDFIFKESIQMAFELFDKYEKLQESEELFKSIVQNGSALTMMTDENGIITYLSPQCESVLGYPANKFIGQGFPDIIHPDDIDKCKHAHQQTFQGHDLHEFEYRIIDSQNKIRWLSHSSKVVKVNEKTIGIQSTVRDITDRKEAEKDLRIKSLLLDQIKDHVTITDLQGVITYVNQAVAETIGHTSQELVGRTTSIYGENHEKGATQQEIVENTLRDGIWRGEVVNFDVSGSEHVMDSRTQVLHDLEGTPIALYGISTDITDRKKAENKLRENEEKQRILLEGSADPIFSFSPEGQYLYVNTAFAEGVGRTVKDVIEKSIWDVFPKDEADKRFAAITHVCITGEQKIIEGPVPNPNGNRYYSTTIKPVKDSDSKVTSVICSAKDITERKKAEETLIESEARFSSAFELASMGMAIISTKGEFLKVNKALCDLLKYTAEELTSLSFQDITHPDDLEADLIHVRKMSAGEIDTHKVEKRYFDKQGKQIWVILSVALVRDSKNLPKYFISQVQDITERKRLEDELRLTIYDLKKSQEISHVGSWKLDMSTNIYNASEESLRIFGFPPCSNPSSQDVAECMHPDDRQQASMAFAHSLQTGEPYTIEIRIFKKDTGELRYHIAKAEIRFDKDGKPVAVLGTNQDITERKMAEKILQESENKYRILTESIQDVVWVLDTQTMYFLYVSPSVQKLRGYTPEEIMALPVDAAFKPEEAKYIKNLIRQRAEYRLSGKEPPDKFYINEVEETCKNGSTVWTEVITSYYINEKTGHVEMRGVTRDISRRKQVENSLRESEERFRTVFQNNSAAMAIIERDTTISMVNKAYCKMSGYDESDVIGLSWTKQIPPEDLERLKEYNRQRLIDPENAPSQYEFMFYCKNGGIRHSLMSVAILPTSGKIVTSFTDITERKLAEEQIKALLSEKELILKEVHHRIKNNMNTLYGLLDLQSNEIKDPAAIAALEDAGSRVQSMMLLYDKLYQSASFDDIQVKEYFPALLDQIIENFPNSSSVKVEKNIDEFILNAKKLSTLGIIINELITNIMKYAFEGRSDGLIKVSASLRNNIVSLIIQDNGKGIPESVDFGNSTGFGLMLINMLTRQLGGTVRMERENGTRIILEFKI